MSRRRPDAEIPEFDGKAVAAAMPAAPGVYRMLNAEGGVRHRAQPFLGDQLARNAANAIGLVLDAHQGVLQVHDVLLLAGGQLGGFLLAHHVTAVFQQLK